MNIVSSWSGGKDSCLACYKAMKQGHAVKYLVNFVSEEYRRCCFHGVTSDLMHAQARAMEIPLVEKAVPADMGAYEAGFKAILTELRDSAGIEGVVFGDIYLDEHKDWVERVCGEVGLAALEPLWHMPAKAVVTEFIDYGFKAVVVSAQESLFDNRAPGRAVTRQFVDELCSRNICPCGENGEFHTFVTDGPLFKKSIRLGKTDAILREGFWKHWFLDIQEYTITAKDPHV